MKTRRHENGDSASLGSAGEADRRSRGDGLARPVTPSFCRTAETWWSTVRIETTSRCAISAFVSPSATSRRISTCRSVSRAEFARVARCGARARCRTPSSRSRAGRSPRRAAHRAGRARASASRRRLGLAGLGQLQRALVGSPCASHAAAAARQSPRSPAASLSGSRGTARRAPRGAAASAAARRGTRCLPAPVRAVQQHLATARERLRASRQPRVLDVGQRAGDQPQQLVGAGGVPAAAASAAPAPSAPRRTSRRASAGSVPGRQAGVLGAVVEHRAEARLRLAHAPRAARTGVVGRR